MDTMDTMDPTDPQYWSVVKNCKLAGVQMRYFSYASAEKCAEQLVEWDRK